MTVTVSNSVTVVVLPVPQLPETVPIAPAGAELSGLYGAGAEPDGQPPDGPAAGYTVTKSVTVEVNSMVYV